MYAAGTCKPVHGVGCIMQCHCKQSKCKQRQGLFSAGACCVMPAKGIQLATVYLEHILRLLQDPLRPKANRLGFLSLLQGLHAAPLVDLLSANLPPSHWRTSVRTKAFCHAHAKLQMTATHNL